MNNQNLPTLTYFFDPLCGWCYGFSPVMEKIYSTFKNQLAIEVMSGGLFTGERTGKINEIAGYIKAGAYKTVEARTGVKFGQAFTDEIMGEGNLLMHSLPPASALCIVKDQFPEQAISFASRLLSAVYKDGINPSSHENLADYAVAAGCERADFLDKIASDDFKAKAKNEFRRFTESGHGGMPTLVASQGDSSKVISHGFTEFEKIERSLNNWLNG